MKKQTFQPKIYHSIIKSRGTIHLSFFDYENRPQLFDVLIISDFIFKQPSTTTIESINKAHKNGARFYGLMIGNHSSACESFLTKMWESE